MQSLVYYLLIVWIFNTTICRCVWFADWSVSKKKTTLITRGDFLCDVFGVISIFVFSRKENKKNGFWIQVLPRLGFPSYYYIVEVSKIRRASNGKAY